MEEKIRVLHIIGSLKYGGAENIAMNYTRYIDKEKFEIDYLVFGEEVGEYEEEAKLLGSRVIHIESPKTGYKSYMKTLSSIFRENKYNIVHSHMMLNSGLIMLIAKFSGVKKRITHSHSTSNGVDESIVYKAYSLCMRAIINTLSTEKFACGKSAGEFLFGTSSFRKKGIVINNGIEIEKYAYNKELREEVREKLGIKNEVLLGHVGRFVSVKNHKFLLEVFYEFNKINECSKLMLIGDGELRGDIEEKIKRLWLEGKVIFTGMVSNVENFLQAIDVFVFPSI